MPEHDTQRERMHAGTPLTVGTVVLLPIERVAFHAHRMGRGLWCAALKEPYAIIIRDAEGARVAGACAEAPTLEALRKQIPDLDGVLAAL